MGYRKAIITGTFNIRFTEVEVTLPDRFDLDTEDDDAFSDIIDSDEFHDSLQDPDVIDEILNLGNSEFEIDAARWVDTKNA